MKTGIDNPNFRHGHAGSRLYNIWAGIKKRCNNKKSSNYKYYGELGITYHPTWEKYNYFYNWAINNGYSDYLTIERINVNGNYEPSNCKWATWDQQRNNKKTSRFHLINGEILTRGQISKKYNISYGKLRDRLNSGVSIENAILNTNTIKGSNQFSIKK